MNEQHILPSRIPKTKIPSLYKWIAPTHDFLAYLVEAEARALALEWANIKNGEHILEVAVGTGLSFQHILQANPDGYNVGVDITPAMLKKARKRAQKVARQLHIDPSHYNLRQGDAYALSFPSHHFNLILNSYMFDLLPVRDFITVLCEFKRVLKPGGRLIQINMTKGHAWYNQFWENLYRLHPSLLGGCRGVMLATYFKEAGFDEVKREYVSQYTFPSEIIQGVRTI